MDENENKIDIIQYLERFYIAFLKLKKIVAIVIITFILFFGGKTLFQFKSTYSSKAIYIPKTNNSSMYVTSDSNDEFLSLFESLIKGNDMKKLINENYQNVSYSIITNRLAGTNLIELKVTSKDAQVSYDIINYILNNYSRVTDKVMNDVTIAVMDTPQLAIDVDEHPPYLKNIMKGCMFGMISSMLFIILYAFTKKNIINKEDVKEILHVDCLTAIPVVPTQKTTQMLLTNPRIQYSFRQAFQELRIKFEQEQKKKQSKMFMFTSTMPNEGKSTISVNVAIALAQHQHSVILVDLDLRNPSILETLNGTNLPHNIIEYLNGDCSLDKVINHPFEYLDVICSEESSDQATELLSLPLLEKMLMVLREKYDYVILDVPPLFMMEDACMVAKHCDSAIVVVRQDYSNAYDILEALEELNDNVPNILGVVMNMVKPSIFDKESQNSSYGYGYGRK